MLIKDKGLIRCAYPSDFENVIIEFTPEEWEELDKLFDFRLKTFPNLFSKTTGKIHKKIKDNQPKLKANYKVVEL